MPHELTGEKRKKAFFKVLSSLILCNNNELFLDRTMNHFLIGCVIIMWSLNCDMPQRWVLYDNQWWLAQWLDWEEAPKHFTKPNLHQKKVLVMAGSSATSLLSESQWNHLRSMLSKWMRCTVDCSTCSRHWGAERAQFFTTTPGCTSHNQHFRSWTNWSTKFCLVHHIHLTSRQPTTTSSSTLMSFCRENTSPTSKRQKMLSKSSLNPKAWIF